MLQSSTPPGSTFTPQARILGIVAAWMTFIVSEVYAVVSGLAYALQGAAVESGPFLSIMALLVVIMGPFLVLSMVAIHAFASPENKAYSLAALAFMIACVAITSCVNFLLLLVSSQPNLFSEAWRALFLPCRWPAPAFVLDNFVWDWFFGISMLLAAPVFGGNTLKFALRLVMILSGVLCIAGLLWLAVSPEQAILVGILGWGAAGPIVFLLLANMFGRVQAATRPTPAP
ncbi:MAG TPA: hypothetical protein VGK00_11590 [Anaerolineales bacterium]|jgi:hypothetical protein